MGSGLLINYNDGTPVMEITAGLRCPSFSNYVDNAWDRDTITINNYVSGSNILVIPRDPVHVMNRGTNLVPTIGMLDGYSQNGSTLKFSTWWSDKWGRSRLFAMTICQVLPIASGRGLLIKDSSDFTAIQDSATAGFCVWRGDITFTGEWRTPDTGVDRGRYIVFAKWSADGVTVEFDGDKIYAKRDTERDDENATVSMRVAIFASGVTPTPGNGLNYINSRGQCTFSTTRRPFIFRNRFWRPSWDYQDVGAGLVMLGRYGFKSRNPDGWCRAKFAGIMRNGNSIRCANGTTKSKWTGRYSVEQSRLISVNIPIIEDMY